MNDVEFVRLARRCRTGDVVEFFSRGGDGKDRDVADVAHDERHEHDEHVRRNGDAPGTSRDASLRRVGVGIVFSFVDPAKPLLVFPSGAGMRIDFFQDVLYAGTPWIRAERFDVRRPCFDGTGEVFGTAQRTAHDATNDTTIDTTHGTASMDRWRAAVERAVGRSLAGDTERFDAYAEGLLGGAWPDPLCEVGIPTGDAAPHDDVLPTDEQERWLAAHLSVMGMSGVSNVRMMPIAESVPVWEGHGEYVFS